MHITGISAGLSPYSQSARLTQVALTPLASAATGGEPIGPRELPASSSSARPRCNAAGLGRPTVVPDLLAC